MFLCILPSSLETSQRSPGCPQQHKLDYELMPQADFLILSILFFPIFYPRIFFLLTTFQNIQPSCKFHGYCGTLSNTPVRMKVFISQVLEVLLVDGSLKIAFEWRCCITEGFTTSLKPVNTQWLVHMGIHRPRPLALIWNNSTRSSQIESLLWDLMRP